MKSVIENVKNSKALNKKNLIILLVSVGFYLFMALFFGPVTASDSKGYIEMISAREPVYPLFLLVFRLIFGKGYLLAVVIAQSLLMGLSVYYLINSLDRYFSLTIYKILLIFLSFVLVSFVCIFFTVRAVPYTNIILTEGLVQSLWIFFIAILFNGFIEEKMSYIYGSLFLTAIMMDVRKQMAIGFIVVFFAILIGWIKKDNYLRRLFLTIIGIVAAVIVALMITRVYNFVLRGTFTQNTRDMNLVLTTTLYVSDDDDINLITDDAARELFVRVRKVLKQNKCSFEYAPKDLAGLQSHYSYSFDKITIDTTAYMFVDDAVDRGFAEGVEAEIEADRVSSEIVKSLFVNNLSKYIKVYISSLSEGFVNSVAKRNSVLDIYALFIYLLYIALMIYNFVKKNVNKGYLGLLVVGAIAVNVAVTGALIFCQTRYMIYNMPLFYAVLVIMLPDTILNKKQENLSESI